MNWFDAKLKIAATEQRRPTWQSVLPKALRQHQTNPHFTPLSVSAQLVPSVQRNCKVWDMSDRFTEYQPLSKTCTPFLSCKPSNKYSIFKIYSILKIDSLLERRCSLGQRLSDSQPQQSKVSVNMNVSGSVDGPLGDLVQRHSIHWLFSRRCGPYYSVYTVHQSVV